MLWKEGVGSGHVLVGVVDAGEVGYYLVRLYQTQLVSGDLPACESVFSQPPRARVGVSGRVPCVNRWSVRYPSGSLPSILT